MLTLKQINRRGNLVEAQYIPENCQERGYVCVNTEKKQIVSSKKTLFDSDVNLYLHHAAYALIKLSSTKELPLEYKVFWY